VYVRVPDVLPARFIHDLSASIMMTTTGGLALLAGPHVEIPKKQRSRQSSGRAVAAGAFSAEQAFAP